MASIYSSVDPGINRYRSAFPGNAHEHIFDCDFFELIPVGVALLNPGDIIRIKNSAFIRTQPMFAPIFSGMTCQFFNFAVPIRVVEGEELTKQVITGYDDNQNEVSVSFKSFFEDIYSAGYNTFYSGRNTLWDLFGFGDVAISDVNATSSICVPNASLWRGYWKIVQEFFIDEDIQDSSEYDWNDVNIGKSDYLFKPFNVSWRKDYFTSMRPSLLKGTIPSLPISGSLLFSNLFNPGQESVYSNFYKVPPVTTGIEPQISPLGLYLGDPDDTAQARVFPQGTDDNAILPAYKGIIPNSMDPGKVFIKPENLNSYVNNSVPANFSSSFTVEDMRNLFAFTRIKERASRCGTRYSEYLRSNFAVDPHDSRLQRPEYLGGSSAPILISEISQTSQSSSDSPQGNLSGKGVSMQSNTLKPYHVTEFMYLYTLMCIRPDNLYMNLSNKQFCARTRWDFFNPSFQNLSEQAVLSGELYLTGLPDDSKVIGYQGRYNEYRTRNNIVSGHFRDQLKYWHLAREFKAPPTLNSDFIQGNATKAGLGRVFNGYDTSKFKPFYVHAYNGYSFVRQMVRHPVPGLIDHS